MADDLFEKLERYRNRALRFLQSLGFTREEAQDITQAALVRVFEHRDQYRGDAVWTYFETTLKHEASNYLRSAKAIRRTANTLPLDDLPHADEAAVGYLWTGMPQESPETLLIDKEEAEIRARLLADAVAGLEQVSRTCMELWLAGLTYEQIAKRMGLSMDAVKSRLFEAKKKVYKRLRENDHGKK